MQVEHTHDAHHWIDGPDLQQQRDVTGNSRLWEVTYEFWSFIRAG
jgi:hypothetical protein